MTIAPGSAPHEPPPTSPTAFRYPPDLASTIRRAARRRRLILWPLIAAPFVLFSLALAPPLLPYVMLILAAGIALVECAFAQREADAIALAPTSLELRGRTLVHMDAAGQEIARVELDAPLKVRRPTDAAGAWTVAASDPPHAPIRFTNHLPVAREILESLLRHPNPDDQNIG